MDVLMSLREGGTSLTEGSAVVPAKRQHRRSHGLGLGNTWHEFEICKLRKKVHEVEAEMSEGAVRVHALSRNPHLRSHSFRRPLNRGVCG